MHQKRFELLHQIGKDINGGVSSDLNINIPTRFTHHFQQSQKQSTPSSSSQNSPPQPHLHIKIPPFSSNSSNQNEPIWQNYSENNNTPISTPHKRPMMSQSSSFARSPTLSSFHHLKTDQGDNTVQTGAKFPHPYHAHKNGSVLNSGSSHKSCPCSSSIPMLLATKRITLRLIHHWCHASWFRVHLKVFTLISLPTVYFLTSNRRWSFLLHLLYFLIFSALLVISLHLGLPRFPSVRLFIEKTLHISLSSVIPPTKHHEPRVVWSIGHKPKTEKVANSGCWVEVYSNGDVYEGEFHKGKCSGSGVYYYHISGRYEGDWVDNKYDGYGVETWAKGSRYRGQYRQGLRNGVGFYRSFTGDVYSGEWCNGQCHGCGFHSCEDGSSYTGEFKWGVKHGLGCYRFRNGDTYAGEYFADKMHGYGVYHFANGHRYEGAWHEGRRQGFGTYTFRNGETQSGYWQNGVLSASSPRGTLPASSTAYDQAKVLHAVQVTKMNATVIGMYHLSP
ncbi:OLC1v1031541C2 [Oldenlandia corymbosa var. corymbosa]|uniref:OLC1v1031541C2 n=1 Tax=Oldenlandia corymbosa var. corymbosa TaxID=529605 RepID=A0AAV1CKI8_OLDCO|nr:OLC1v1031541C2 [Oldenlandia corymbosa var. corymbosa]